MSNPDAARDALDAAYGALVHAATRLDEASSWSATACTGWSARDLLFHCLGDAQRALVALHSPTEAPADRDGVTYWQDWTPNPVGAANGRRFVRVASSMFLQYGQLRDLFIETMKAVLHAAKQVPEDQRLRTQGHVLTCSDLLRTLTVEASLHHLDLLATLPNLPATSPSGLATTRKTVEQLLGTPLPAAWDDAYCARVATGRTPLSEEDRRLIGSAADRVPVFA